MWIELGVQEAIDVNKYPKVGYPQGPPGQNGFMYHFAGSYTIKSNDVLVIQFNDGKEMSLELISVAPDDSQSINPSNNMGSSKLQPTTYAFVCKKVIEP